MRLWHQSLIPYLDRERLLGQHREICALRGNGWGKKHATVDYVFKHGGEKLFAYHTIVMTEMRKRGYSVCENWWYSKYHGKALGFNYEEENLSLDYFIENETVFYPEHDRAYLLEYYSTN